MRIVFAPFYAENPYQANLQKQLEILGCIVFRARPGLKGFFNNQQVRESEIIHFHWTHPYVLRGALMIVLVKMAYFLNNLRKLKKEKKKVIWTVHNISSHNRKYYMFEILFLKNFIKLIDGFSVHNQYTKEQLIKRFKIDASKIFTIPHANYIDAYTGFPDAPDMNADILKLASTNKRTFMLFGHIRAYKGALDVIASFKKLNKNKNQLIICGKVGDDQSVSLLKEAIGEYSNILLYPKFVKDEEIKRFFNIADIMLYPYKDITTSGSLILGMSFAKACLCADVGDMKSLVGTYSTFKSQEEFESKITEFSQLSTHELVKMGRRNYDKVKPYTWESMAVKTMEMYNQVTSLK